MRRFLQAIRKWLFPALGLLALPVLDWLIPWFSIVAMVLAPILSALWFIIFIVFDWDPKTDRLIAEAWASREADMAAYAAEHAQPVPQLEASPETRWGHITVDRPEIAAGTLALPVLPPIAAEEL